MNTLPNSALFPDAETMNKNGQLKSATDIAIEAPAPQATSGRSSGRRKNADTISADDAGANAENGASPEKSRKPRRAASKNKTENTDATAKRSPRRPASRRKASPQDENNIRQAPVEQPQAEGLEEMDATPEAEAPYGGLAPEAKETSDGVPKKSRRGKRGGKRKNARPEASLDVESRTPVDPLETAIALQKIPALPPAPEADAQTATGRKTREAARKEQPVSVKTGKKRMFISVIPGEQVEVGLAEEGVLLEYYLDMLHHRKLKGNIYKGIIHNIDTNLQAAFIDFGVGKNGFLQIDEVHPEYWQDMRGDSGDNKRFPPIQKVLRPGQEVLVQVVKEPSGNKGAFLTTWLSLAGRFLVLTPGQEQIGVSRKVTDQEERNRLREMMNGIDPGNGLGVIVRTVGEGATKTTLKTDLQYLKRLWREIRKKATELPAPAMLHQEPGLSERSVRDYLTDDVSEIWVDNEDEAVNVRAMANLLFPRKKNLVHIFTDVSQSLWDHFKLRRQLEQIYAREVPLPSGGRLVFDQTEALMAIDINSGKISGKNNFETMAFKTNMEASLAIARQLRLRDIGGQVVIDFIEMREKKHVLEVEKALRQAMKNDRARHDVARMSAFGLLELVRQRMGSSALSISMEICSMCGGTGLRRNLEWQALQTLRDLRQKLQGGAGEKYTCEYPRELGLYLLNYKRDALRSLEQAFGKTLEIKIQI